MHETKFILDFKKEAIFLLKDYHNRPLNLMIAGGSVATLLGNTDFSTIDASKWQIFLSDERMNSTDTNLLAAQQFAIKTKAKIYPFELDEYEEFFMNNRIDLAILGIGEDGHIASLFPNKKALWTREIVLQINDSPKEPSQRNTITVKFINERISRLFFFVPPVNDKKKEVTMPHFSIAEKLKIPFVVYLSKE